MSLQTLPRSAVDHYAEQRRVMVAALGAARRLWGVRPPGDFDRWFQDQGPALAAVVVAAQSRAVAGADRYTAESLDELGAPVEPEARVNTSPLVGVASDGRDLLPLMYGAIITAKGQVARTDSAHVAWRSGRSALLTRVQTQVADASRVAVGLSTAVRPGVGHVRMLNPPSCSRCAVLAGRHYRSAAFLRHPGCDCRMVPATRAAARDLVVDPRDYFDSLATADQDRLFTTAGAEAIRAGADPAQVVNARRGLYTASAYGRDLRSTGEGVTRRGLANAAMRQAQYIRAAGETKSGRYRILRAPRLMPEAIAQIADDRTEYLRLLRLYGYLR